MAGCRNADIGKHKKIYRLGFKKIVVIGPESTGKSTLSEALARRLKTLWVPEYAREYLDLLNRPYEENDLLRIAEGQISSEEEKSASAEDFLICDTDLHVIKVWSEHKYNHCHPWILEQVAVRRYDFYILTDIDLPWEPDPWREHPDPFMRRYFHHVYLDIVQNTGVPWTMVTGGEEERLQQALTAIARI